MTTSIYHGNKTRHLTKPRFLPSTFSLLPLTLLILLACENPAADNFIAVNGISGAPAHGSVAVEINLNSAAVTPANATNKTIVWTIAADDDHSTGVMAIRAGKCTPANEGALKLTATVSGGAAAGVPYTNTFSITITLLPAPAAPANWTPVANPAMTGEIQTVCFGNDVFVAGSRENDGKAAWSVDGINWTGVDVDGFSTNFVHIKFLNNEFWAVGGAGHIARSANGAEWTAVTQSAIIYNIAEIAYGNGVFVAAGDSGHMAYSVGGTSWTANDQTAVFGIDNFKAIGWAAGKFLAVGQSAKAIYSTNGITWTNISATMAPLIGTTSGGWAGMSVVTYGAGRYFTASQGLILSSPDCVTWEKTEMAQFGFPRGHRWGWINCLIYVNGLFVLGGGDGNAAYSHDGRNWTQITTTNTIFHDYHFINGLAYGAGKFVAVGATGPDDSALTNNARIAYSMSD